MKKIVIIGLILKCLVWYNFTHERFQRRVKRRTVVQQPKIPHTLAHILSLADTERKPVSGRNFSSSCPVIGLSHTLHGTAARRFSLHLLSLLECSCLSIWLFNAGPNGCAGDEQRKAKGETKRSRRRRRRFADRCRPIGAGRRAIFLRRPVEVSQRSF